MRNINYSQWIRKSKQNILDVTYAVTNLKQLQLPLSLGKYENEQLVYRDVSVNLGKL